MSQFEDIFRKYMPLVGQWGGHPYDIYRPDYSQVDNTPALVEAAVRFRVDPTTGKLAEPRYQGIMNYDVFGPYQKLEAGDLLVRSAAVLDASGYPSSPSIMYPIVTVLTFDEQKSLNCIRTARMARIQDSKGDPDSVIYEPVYFDWLGQGFPGTTLNRNLAESLRIPSQRACIFTRTNVARLRSHLVEIDLGIMVPQDDGSELPYERTWLIEEIDHTGPLMVLTLRNA